MIFTDFVPIKKNYLYEGLDINGLHTVKLWESVGRELAEAALTPQQIQQIFANVEQSATASGSNRTMIGQGKDVASSVGRAWEDLKTKVSTSAPVKNVDAYYDAAAAKLKQATGGDQGVMQYVQKYRDFAKKHPVAQSLIYSALIAAAGISGAGAGGAAALGLFKLVDKLLQGEKFSSAAYQGAKTGGLAYAAGQIGQAMKGQPQGQVPPGGSDVAGAAATGSYGDIYRAAQREGLSAARQAIESGQVSNYNSVLDITDQIMANVGTKLSPQSYEIVERMIRTKLSAGLQNVKESAAPGIVLTNEAISDMFKKAASSAGNWLKTKGTNLTTKVTADKLMQAWKKAGSPTDSLEVASVIQRTGVPAETIKQVYNSMSIPFAGQAGAQPTATRNIELDRQPVVTAKPVTPKPAAPGATAAMPATTPVAKTATPQATSASAMAPNVIKYSGLAKPKPPAPKVDFSKPGFTGYQTAAQPAAAPAPAAKPAAATAPAVQEPITIGGQKIQPTDPAYNKIMRKYTNNPYAAESLEWSKNFDPSRTLLNKMRK